MSRLQDRELVVGITPFEEPNAALAVALARAGSVGVLDLGPVVVGHVRRSGASRVPTIADRSAGASRCGRAWCRFAVAGCTGPAIVR
jgi:hypothetical protein